MNKFNVKLFSIIFFIGMIVVSCKDDDSSSLTPVAPPVVEEFGSFSASIDGIDFNMVAKLNNNIEPAVGGQETTDATVSPSVTKKNYNSSLTNTSDNTSSGVSIGEIEYSGSLLPTKSEFLALFSVGDKSYSKDLTNGVEIYIIENGVIWSSTEGTADQTGSTFKLTNAMEGNVLGTDNVEIEATFSCTLYDDTGNSRVLTNGKFKGVFENS